MEPFIKLFVVREVNQLSIAKIRVWTLTVHDWLKMIQKHTIFLLISNEIWMKIMLIAQNQGQIEKPLWESY